MEIGATCNDSWTSFAKAKDTLPYRLLAKVALGKRVVGDNHITSVTCPVRTHEVGRGWSEEWDIRPPDGVIILYKPSQERNFCKAWEKVETVCDFTGIPVVIAKSRLPLQKNAAT